MTKDQRRIYEMLVDEFLAVEGDPEKIENYGIKRRKLNKLGNKSVEDRRVYNLTRDIDIKWVS